MKTLSRQHSAAAIAVLIVGLACVRAGAAPHIGYVYPGGGQQGTTVEVTVGGQYLAGTKAALFSGDGVRAKVLLHATPLSEQNYRAATMKLQEVGRYRSAGRQAMEEDEQAQAEHMQLMAAKAADEFEICAAILGLDDPTPRGFAKYQRIYTNPRRQPNAQISETVTLEVTIAPDAIPGMRELRLETHAGVTNPIYMHVGQVREYNEKEPNDWEPDNGVMSCTMEGMELADAERLPVMLNGQVKPGDVDRFQFEVPKGTRLVASVSARSLVPYLADAVPGWFQATLALLDPEGREVAYTDDFRFDPDPVIYYEAPRSGAYTLEIKDSIYRGREDFVYRILVGEEPFVTSVFPLGGQAGTKTRVELTGWNLPVKELTVDGGGGPGPRHLSVSKDGHLSNVLPFAVDELPEQFDSEPNDDCAGAAKVNLPLIVNGRIDRPGDWDVFRMEGKAGDEVYTEVYARRLRSPVDSVLKVTDATGKILASNDDFLDKVGHLHRGPGLITHHADSQLSFKFPEDGPYFLHIGDTQHHGGPAYAYRLRISPCLRDFDLMVVPSSICADAGAVIPVTVHAVRKDGFSGDISLAMSDSESGFVLGGGWVPAGRDSVRMTLTLPRVTKHTTFSLHMEGRATIDGKEIRRLAVPAEDTMQAFLWRHLVPTDEWAATVRGDGRAIHPPRVLSDAPLRIPVGGDASVAVYLRHDAEEVKVDLMEPPEGVSVQKVSSEPNRLSIVLSADAETAKSGLKGNLIAEAYMERPMRSKDGKELPPQRVSLGTLPAIPFEIAAK